MVYYIRPLHYHMYFYRRQKWRRRFAMSSVMDRVVYVFHVIAQAPER